MNFGSGENRIHSNIRIYSETGSGQMAVVPIKLQNKLSTELGEHVEAITGMTFSLFKFFYGSTTIDGDKYLSSYPDIFDEMEIIGAAGFSKPYKFMRFKNTYHWPYWGYHRTTNDAMAFIPNKNVVVYGFSVYGACEPEFTINFKVYVDDVQVEEDEMTLTDYEDKYFCRIKLKKFHLVKGGSKLEIMATLARSSGSDTIYTKTIFEIYIFDPLSESVAIWTFIMEKVV